MKQIPDQTARTNSKLGYPGDWLLRRPGLSLVVAGNLKDSRRRRPLGSIVDAVVSQSAEDELRSLTPIVWVGKAEQPLRPVSVSASRGQALRVVHESFDGKLQVITDIRLQAEDGLASLTTRLWNKGKRDYQGVALGDRLIWPDGPSYVPGQGFIKEPTRRLERWVARPGKQLSYILFTENSPLELTFGFDPNGTENIVALGPPTELPAGGTVFHQRYLGVAPGALPSVLARMWRKLDIETGQVQGRVSPAPQWAQIEAFNEQGPVAIVDVELGGAFALPLPTGEYQLVARCPGGEDVEPIKVSKSLAPIEVIFTAPAVGTLKYRVIDGEQQPCPARLTLMGAPPTRTPTLAAKPSAQGAGNVVYTSTGIGEIPLPPGDYDVYVSRGPQYSLHQQRISVSAATGAVLKAQLAQEWNAPGWLSADLHVHAAPSYDCEVSLEDRVTALLAEGLDAAVATDHNAITDYSAAAAASGQPIVTAAGVEITTWDPNLGHFNVWPLPAEAQPPPFVGQDADQLLTYLADNYPEAVIQTNHPRMAKYGIGYFDIFELDPRSATADKPGFSTKFNAVEVLNGTELDDPGIREAVLTDWMGLLTSGKHVTATAGSDSHHLFNQWMGWPRSYIRVVTPPGGRVLAADLARGVRLGAVVASNGVFVDLTVDGAGPGDTIAVTDDAVKIVAQAFAASWVPVESIAIWHDGEIVAEGGCGNRASTERCRMILRLPVSKPGWIAATAEGGSLAPALPGLHGLAFGLANPVYLTVNADGP